MNSRLTIHNHPVLKQRRKALRNEATSAERELWMKLKQRSLGGYKFRRQHSVGPYILDFYCPEARLCVELDGESHLKENAIAYDKERSAYLSRLNIQVLRFLNTDVYENIDAVCENILGELGKQHHPLPPS